MTKTELLSLLDQMDKAQTMGNLRRSMQIVGEILKDLVSRIPDDGAELYVNPQVEMTDEVRKLREAFILPEDTAAEPLMVTTAPEPVVEAKTEEKAEEKAEEKVEIKTKRRSKTK
jgi:hypothetical protein